MASNKNAKEFESIQYNNDLKLVRNIRTDMFQCQSIMKCLGYNEKKYKYVDQYFNLKGTKDLIEEMGASLKLGRLEIVVELDDNTENEYKGTYIHRFLISHFSSWYCPRYCFKIQLILDAVLKEQMKQKDEEIITLNKKNDLQDKLIFENSIRTDINRKKVRIVKIKDEESLIPDKFLYYVSSNNKKVYRGGKLVREYIFPGGIDVRQYIKKIKERKGAYPGFEEDELPDLYEFIDSLSPKNKIKIIDNK
jgi:hypothetical protein